MHFLLTIIILSVLRFAASDYLFCIFNFSCTSIFSECIVLICKVIVSRPCFLLKNAWDFLLKTRNNENSIVVLAQTLTLCRTSGSFKPAFLINTAQDKRDKANNCISIFDSAGLYSKLFNNSSILHTHEDILEGRKCQLTQIAEIADIERM